MKNKQKRILFIITRLGGGGAERVMGYIIKYLNEHSDYDITLLLLKKDGNTYLKSIPSGVNIKILDIPTRIRFGILKIIRTILGLKPDLLFCGLDKLNILLALFLPLFKVYNIRSIVRETNVLSCQYNSKNIIIKYTYRLFYNLYDCIIAQSEDMRTDLIRTWRINSRKIIKINNPIDIETVHRRATKSSQFIKKIYTKNYIMIGRLSHQKGYDLFFKQFALCSPSDIHITVFGKGELEVDLHRQIKAANIQNMVTFAGYCENPYAELAESDGLILSSRFEGFPNVLLEANALGKPIFANQCPGGINEIIIPHQNGEIANFNDMRSFQSAFSTFINTKYDPSLIMTLTTDRYAMDIIMPIYKKVFDQLL